MAESEGVFILDLHDFEHDRDLLAAAGVLLVEIGKDACAREEADAFDSEAGAELLFLLAAPFTAELARRLSGEVVS